jgi:hypothetical protein
MMLKSNMSSNGVIHRGRNHGPGAGFRAEFKHACATLLQLCSAA